MKLALSQVVAYNNIAVGAHQEGKLPEAVIALKTAIDYLRVVVNSLEQQQGHPQVPQEHPVTQGLSVRQLLHAHYNPLLNASFSSVTSEAYQDTQKALTAVPTFCSLSADDGNTPPSFYDQAFSIREEEDRHDIICAVVFYNLALVQHKRNAHRGSSLCRILTLYEKAAMVTKNLCVSEDSVRLLLLAISNNMMHIHSTLFDRSALENSLADFQALVYERPADDEDDVFDFFVFSSIYYGSDPLQCAPMA